MMVSKDSKPLSAEIVPIGNEIVSGLILDSNSRYLCQRLQQAGVSVSRITAVGDDEDAIQKVIEEALRRADWVILTGGLGATHDDITKNVIVKMFQLNLKKDPKVADGLEEWYRTRGRSLPSSIHSQYMVPEKARVLYNEKGTAPGLMLDRDGKILAALPGIPLEMEHLFETYIFPEIQSKARSRILHRMIRTTGLTEAAVWEKVGSLDPLQALVSVASLPSHLGVNIRLTAEGPSAQDVATRLGKAEKLLNENISRYIYGVDNDTLEEKVGVLLTARKQTLAVAESCTGGLIGHRLTQVSGSSRYFLEGAVTYSDQAKMNRLGVPEQTLKKFGAVSRETAEAMAKGIRESSGADIGLSVTGIAGPQGGSAEKPVGLTFMGLSHRNGCQSREFRFHQDRSRNKERAAQAALNILRLHLMDQ